MKSLLNYVRFLLPKTEDKLLELCCERDWSVRNGTFLIWIMGMAEIKEKCIHNLVKLILG